MLAVGKEKVDHERERQLLRRTMAVDGLWSNAIKVPDSWGRALQVRSVVWSGSKRRRPLLAQAMGSVGLPEMLLHFVLRTTAAAGDRRPAETFP